MSRDVCLRNFGWNSQVKLGTWIPSCVQIAPGSQCRNRNVNVFKLQEEPKRGIKGVVIKTGPYKCKCRHAPTKRGSCSARSFGPLFQGMQMDGAGVCYTCAIIRFLQDLHGCFCLQRFRSGNFGAVAVPQALRMTTNCLSELDTRIGIFQNSNLFKMTLLSECKKI